MSIPSSYHLTRNRLAYNIWRMEANSIIFQEPSTPEQDREKAREKIIAACTRTANLLRYGHNAFGLMNFPSHTMHAAAVCANHLISYVAEPQIPDVFHTMILTLTAVCYRWTLAKGITQGLWITVQQQDLQKYLQEETISLFQLNAVKDWSTQDYQLFVSCAYPNYATSNGNPRDVTSIGDIIQGYSKLNIDDTAQEPSSSK